MTTAVEMESNVENAFGNAFLLKAFPSSRMFNLHWIDRDGRSTRQNVYALVSVDVGDGLIGTHGNLTNAQRIEIYDLLVEDELAVWRAIGPEDSELFATDKFLALWPANAPAK